MSTVIHITCRGAVGSRDRQLRVPRHRPGVWLVRIYPWPRKCMDIYCISDGAGRGRSCNCSPTTGKAGFRTTNLGALSTESG